jgi:hypothetical protein
VHVALANCQVEGCTLPVSKDGYTFCLDHWKAERAGHVIRCEKCDKWHDNDHRLCRACAKSSSGAGRSNSNRDDDETPSGFLSSTRIGKHFDLSSIKVNLILAELGWIEKYVKGWLPTDRGNALGANVREARNGVPFVVWPDSILKNTALLNSIKEQTGDTTPSAAAAASAALQPPNAPEPSSSPKPQGPGPKAASSSPADDFRSKFPANFRTQDGHQVRSRAEVLIDNWLYMQGLVHAYERRLPIEEECYCDFYLPGGKGVYIEFWGMESDPKYAARQSAKRGIYTKHNLRLIELNDADIEHLDDVLPRMLLRFGIESA